MADDVKNIRQNGAGDYTTIATWAAYVFATYGSSAFPNTVIGRITDSGTYTENVVFNTGLAPTYTYYMKLESTATTKETFPVWSGVAGTRCTYQHNTGVFLITGIKFYGAGIGINPSSGVTQSYLTVFNCWFDSMGAAISYVTVSNQARWEFGGMVGNLVTNCLYGVNSTGTANPGTMSCYNIINNTFYNCTTSAILLNALGSSTVIINNIRNNIFYVPAGAYAINFGGGSQTYSNADNNCFYIAAGGHLGWKTSTNYDTLAAWQAATSQDLASIEADPLFVNAAGGDYRLQDVSPAISLGIYATMFLIPYTDLYGADFDNLTPSAGCHQKLTVLRPGTPIRQFPISRISDTTPTGCWKVGTRDIGGYAGATAGTAQVRIYVANADIHALLNSALTVSTATVTYDTLVGSFPASGTIIIDDEMIAYTGNTGTQLTGCTRGAYGTIAVAHADNTVFMSILNIYDSWLSGQFYNALKPLSYSSNFNPAIGADPDVFGDWTLAGTGDPSSNGTEGVNGVSVDPTVTRYMKIPLGTLSEGINYCVGCYEHQGGVV